MVYSYFILWLSDGVLTQVKNIKLVKLLQDKLRVFYEFFNFSIDFLYLKEFFNIKLEVYNFIKDYIAKLKTLTDDFKKYKLILPNKLVIVQTFFYLIK